MRIEFRDLRWALVAAQHRSLRQAAQTLNVRESTLSRCLSDLEHKLGGSLFERSSGGTRPTVEGHEFLAAARRIIEQTEAITTRLKTRARGEAGRLTIGIHASMSAGNLRATLVDYRRRFPDVDAHLIDGPTDHLISDVASGAVDIAFVAGCDPPWGDKSLSVWSERVVVALADDHPLCRQEVVGWRDLKNETLLLPQRGPGPEFFKLFVSKIGSADSSGLRRHDVGLDRLLTLVGAGWGILLALEGATGGTYPGVAFREVHDADGATRLNFRAYWREANANPTLHPFLGLLRERYPDLSAASAAG
jgi:DNA-binding transcriptional LysR family regulator